MCRMDVCILIAHLFFTVILEADGQTKTKTQPHKTSPTLHFDQRRSAISASHVVCGTVKVAITLIFSRENITVLH